MIYVAGKTYGLQYHIYHHCYYEGVTCGTKNISCSDNLVISIVWSIIGRSDYWESDGSRQNCSVTDNTCYQNVSEPSTKCSGLQTCTLYTCSSVTHQQLPCTGISATNFLRINYTCIEGELVTTGNTFTCIKTLSAALIQN